MQQYNRKGGLDIIGDIAWGTHICQLYETKDDLIDILVPYFKAGLESNEFCMWVTSEPLRVEEAKGLLSKEVKNLDKYFSKGQLEVLDYSDWYSRSGKFDGDEVLQGWVEKEKLALEKGLDGLRLSGNTFWLERKDWKSFANYEQAVDSVIGDHRMIALCTYALQKCSASDIIDVVSNHEFAIIRRQGKWESIGSAKRKAQEEKILLAYESFRNSVDTCPLGVRIVTAGGGLLYANQAIIDTYGYSSLEELKSTPTKQRYTPKSYAEHVERREKRRRGEYVPDSYEISIVRKDGEIRQLEVSRREVLWNGERHFQAIYRDVTQRRKAEMALRAERERLEVTLRSTGDGVIATDLEGRVALINRVAEAMTGWTNEEAVGKPLDAVLNIVDEKTRRRIADPVEKVLKTGRIVGLINHAVLIGRDGTEYLIADSGAPIHDEIGNMHGVVLVFRDITHTRRLEEELERAARLESLSRLAGGIAHDFNNLLTGIMGNIGLAVRCIERGEGDILDRLGEAEKASVRAKDLTQQLLTFARGGAPIKKLASIRELIEGTATFALRGSNVKLELSLPDDLWCLEIDEGQISQVIANLVINANEAMPEGGAISIATRNTIIHGKRSLPLRGGKYIVICIKDTGIGMPDQHLNRLFEPYFSTKQKGRGLGLATAYSIVKRHGGHITAKSELGKGTSFQIYLPVSKKTPSAKKETVTEAPLIGKGRILVMDDEEMIRELLRSMLTLAGYEVELASDGVEAIEHYTKAKESGQPFEAVILDLTVPGRMGGKEAMKKLLDIDPNVKAIVSSGYSTDPIMADFKKYGFSAVVVKPYTLTEMENAIGSITKRKK